MYKRIVFNRQPDGIWDYDATIIWDKNKGKYYCRAYIDSFEWDIDRWGEFKTLKEANQWARDTMHDLIQQAQNQGHNWLVCK